MNKFWMVYGVGNNQPRVQHATLALAQAEARRLAERQLGTVFVVLEAVEKFSGKCEVSSSGFEDWTVWAGGERWAYPVLPDQKVEVRYRNDKTEEGLAKQFDWAHDRMEEDILAYRVIGAA